MFGAQLLQRHLSVRHAPVGAQRIRLESREKAAESQTLQIRDDVIVARDPLPSGGISRKVFFVGAHVAPVPDRMGNPSNRSMSRSNWLLVMARSRRPRRRPRQAGAGRGESARPMGGTDLDAFLREVA